MAVNLDSSVTDGPSTPSEMNGAFADRGWNIASWLQDPEDQILFSTFTEFQGFIEADPANLDKLLSAIFGENFATLDENTKFTLGAALEDAISGEGLYGYQKPEFRLVGYEGEDPAATEWLPEGVDGAFIDGEDGGTILIADALLNENDRLINVSVEEVGESIAAFFNGNDTLTETTIALAPGDVGDRILKTLQGEDIEADLWVESADDTAEVMFGGEMVEATASDDSYADEVDTFLNYLRKGSEPEYGAYEKGDLNRPDNVNQGEWERLWELYGRPEPNAVWADTNTLGKYMTTSDFERAMSDGALYGTPGNYRVNPQNISAENLVDQMFEYINNKFHDGDSGRTIMTIEDLNTATDRVLNDENGIRGDDFDFLKNNFTSWDHGNPGDLRFTKADLIDLFENQVIIIRKPGGQDKDHVSIDVDHNTLGGRMYDIPEDGADLESWATSKNEEWFNYDEEAVREAGIAARELSSYDAWGHINLDPYLVDGFELHEHQWELVQKLYGVEQGGEYLLTASGLARAIADNVVQVKELSPNFPGQPEYGISKVDLRNVSGYAAADAIIQSIRQETGQPDRNLFHMDQIDAVTDGLFNDHEAIHSSDYEPLQNIYADISGKFFSRDAIAAMFTTGAISIRDDVNAKDHFAIVVDYPGHSNLKSGSAFDDNKGDFNIFLSHVSESSDVEPDAVFKILKDHYGWTITETEDGGVTVDWSLPGDEVLKDAHKIGAAIVELVEGASEQVTGVVELLLGEILENDQLIDEGREYLNTAKEHYANGESDFLQGITMIATGMDDTEAAELINSVGAKVQLLKDLIEDPVDVLQSVVSEIPAMISQLWGDDEIPDPGENPGAAGNGVGGVGPNNVSVGKGGIQLPNFSAIELPTLSEIEFPNLPEIKIPQIGGSPLEGGQLEGGQLISRVGETTNNVTLTQGNPLAERANEVIIPSEHDPETDPIIDHSGDDNWDLAIGLDLAEFEFGSESFVSYGLQAGASLSYPTRNDDGQLETTFSIALNDVVGVDASNIIGGDLEAALEGGHELSIDLVLDDNYLIQEFGDVKFTASTAVVGETGNGASQALNYVGNQATVVMDWMSRLVGGAVLPYSAPLANMTTAVPGLTGYMRNNFEAKDVVSAGFSFEFNLSEAVARGEWALIAELFGLEILARGAQVGATYVADLPALLGPTAALAATGAGGIALEGLANWASAASWDAVDDELVEVGGGVGYGLQANFGSIGGVADWPEVHLDLGIYSNDIFEYHPVQ